MRVLLVEDERPLARYIAVGLRKHGFAVDVAYDGVAALDKCGVTPYDVVVLDRDLPGVHGDAVCRRLASEGRMRVLMLTASDAVEDRVEGLRLGADDYLGKPFAFSNWWPVSMRWCGAATRRVRRCCAPPMSSWTPRAGPRSAPGSNCA